MLQGFYTLLDRSEGVMLGQRDLGGGEGGIEATEEDLVTHNLEINKLVRTLTVA